MLEPALGEEGSIKTERKGIGRFTITVYGKAAHAGLEPEVPGIRLRIEGSIGRPSMELTPRNLALWDQARQIGTQLGLDLNRAKVGGGSDGNTTSQFTATLDGLGPVGHGAHAKREFLYVDKTLERAALLTMLLISPPVAAEALEKTA